MTSQLPMSVRASFDPAKVAEQFVEVAPPLTAKGPRKIVIPNVRGRARRATCWVWCNMIVTQGSGTPFADIPIINSYISKLPSDHDLLRALHHLLFKSFGKKSRRKKNLRQFCGFEDFRQRSSVVNSLSGNKRWTTATISNLADMLDITVSGKSKSEMIEIVADFLQAPGVSERAPQKRKANPALDPNNRSRKRRGPKRPLTAYFRYVKDVRQRVLQENPEVAVTQIASIIGAEWRKLDETKRAEYKDAAKQALEEYKVHMAKLEASGALDDPSRAAAANASIAAVATLSLSLTPPPPAVAVLEHPPSIAQHDAAAAAQVGVERPPLEVEEQSQVEQSLKVEHPRPTKAGESIA